MAKKINMRQKIRKQMKRQKISVPEMSRRIACNQQTLYNWLKNDCALGSDRLEAVLAELGGRLVFEKD